LNPEAKLFLAKRLWDLPRSLDLIEPRLCDRAPKEATIVNLPKEVCAESLLPDPLMMLHSVILPQILYQAERYITAEAFVRHCQQYFPILGQSLSSLRIESILEVLTFRACKVNVDYDRLEWLGDAVLKLLQTEHLHQWEYTSYLHEGYLSSIRSILGSNVRLEELCQAAGFDNYILRYPLNREDWRPMGLSLRKASEANCNLQDLPSGKMCADDVESVLGLLFVQCGYDMCVAVAKEIGLSLASELGERKHDYLDGARSE